MERGMVLKNAYRIGEKVKEDQIGVLYNGTLVKSGITISIREYHNQFCHASIVEYLQNCIINLAGIDHPQIVRVIDSLYTDDKRFFIIYDTPYEGCLEDIISKFDSFPPREALGFVNNIGRVLEHLHEKRIIHGGLNPDNIDMLSDGNIKLRNAQIDDLLNSFVINNGLFVLDQNYLSSEQLRGEKSRKATDVFALGVLTYRLLSGKKPYPEVSSIPMLLKNYLKLPAKITLFNPEIPKYMEDIVFKALQNNPNFRHQSITELLGDFRNKKVTVGVEELRRRHTEAEKNQQAQQIADSQNNSQHVNMPTGRVAPTSGQPEARLASSPQPKDYRRGNIPANHTQQPTREVHKKNMAIIPEDTTTTIWDEEKPHKNKLQQAIQYLLFGVAAAVIILFFNALFVSYFDSVPKIEIPPLTGIQLEQAEQILQKNGLRFKVIGYLDDETVSANSIVSTNPEAGRIVKQNRIVRLFISRGAADLVVPNLIDRDINRIRNLTEERGFNLIVDSYVYHNQHLPNYIVSQTPEANTNAIRGSELRVVVSRGYPVNLQLIDKNERNSVIKLSMRNLENWQPQNIMVFIQDSSGRHKRYEKLVQPGSEESLEVVAENSAVIEVYYFNDLALKQELKTLQLSEE